MNSTGRSSQFVHIKSISAVEGELEDEYKQEMCGYLRLKLKNMVEKRKKDIVFDKLLNNTLEKTDN